MALKFNEVRAVVKLHVPAKYHEAACNGSLVIVLTEKKNSSENNTVRRYRADSKKDRELLAFAVMDRLIRLIDADTIFHCRRVYRRTQKHQNCWRLQKPHSVLSLVTVRTPYLVLKQNL